MKIVINKRYGGFGLSEKAFEALIEKGWIVTSFSESGSYEDPSADIVDRANGPKKYPSSLLSRYGFVSYSDRASLRTDTDLIEIVEKLGESANGPHANLKIVDIPDGIEWEISEYDGMESVEEKHRSWS